MSEQTTLHSLLDAYAQRTGYAAPYAFAALRAVLDEINELRLFAVQAAYPLAAETAYRVADQFEQVIKEALEAK